MLLSQELLSARSEWHYAHRLCNVSYNSLLLALVTGIDNVQA